MKEQQSERYQQAQRNRRLTLESAALFEAEAKGAIMRLQIAAEERELGSIEADIALSNLDSLCKSLCNSIRQDLG